MTEIHDLPCDFLYGFFFATCVAKITTQQASKLKKRATRQGMKCRTVVEHHMQLNFGKNY